MRILIAEDDDTLRLLLQLQLEDVADIDVVASAATPQDALRLADEHEPEAAVVDVRMPGVEGAELLAALRSRRPAMGLVAYSSSAGAAVGRQLADLGIPLVLKGELPRLIEALRSSAEAARQ
jgi:DNA-binding NarL/FixJ family response regulator